MDSVRHHIHLHGKLAEFGESFELAINTPLEAVRALASQIKGFAESMWEGEYYVIRGDDPETGRPYHGEDLAFNLSAEAPQHIHFIPVVAGAKNGGVGKAILGAVIMVASVVASPFTFGGSIGFGTAMNTAILGGALGSMFTFGAIFALGGAMFLGGIGQIIQASMRTDYNSNESADNRGSFFLNGQVNQYHQGGPVKLPYGQIRVGSDTISLGLTAEQLNKTESSKSVLDMINAWKDWWDAKWDNVREGKN